MAGVCKDRLYPTGIGATSGNTYVNCLAIDDSGYFHMGGNTLSSSLSGKSFKKAFYAIYSQRSDYIKTEDAKIIGTGSEFEDVTACSFDSVSDYTAFLVTDPTLIFFNHFASSATGSV